MPFSYEIKSLAQPTDEEVGQITDILVDAFKDDPLVHTGSGGNKSLEPSFHRVGVASALLVGRLFVAIEQETSKIIGTVFFSSPGPSIWADKERSSKIPGYLAHLDKLSENARLKFTEAIEKYAHIDVPGVDKTNAWSVNSLAVASPYRRKGVAHALLAAGEALAEADKGKVVLEAGDEETLQMYKNFGYHHAGTTHIEGYPFYVAQKDFSSK
ncbi:hypothetical protein EIP91_010895 [Steccherinum ochraceum]|uniref:N-acetyltransferase domain-containing protein n=1 Tax=Steccherinum ochraceum TaxID=92696 RepID=A0A4R0RLE9_9APHY|nr:hypothetical protein EIP91_010895 [Steccherinum ochraceum]